MKLAAALWRVRPGDRPRPAALTRDLRWDVLSLNQQLWLLPPQPEDEVLLTDFVEVSHEIRRARRGAV
ncbi:hypothetical protein [Actinacidiphila oryziradicis]|uniref:Uncharacterized protein n=1 Tax=Actinacidiphila oryziradicis TaxID=2571141 RepID=A0A4U0S100_9ACTN|nr:hypothetical protein [Actinacidiphila oryziradicis]TKA00721.1 hypothetical protein FCI23_42130 [Actinacidiphila oryziradicis]